VAQDGVFSIFIFFKNVFIEIYFWFHNLQFYIPTGAYRPSAGRPAPCRPLSDGRDLYIIKI
jgi:hypothetical protein